MIADPVVRSAITPCHDPAHTRTRVLHHHGPRGGDRRHLHPDSTAPCPDCVAGIRLYRRMHVNATTVDDLRAEAARMLAEADSIERNAS